MGLMMETRQDLPTHTRFTEEASRLDSAEMLDGLQPAQIVRRWTKSGGGLAASVAVDFIDTMQECPDAGVATPLSDARKHEFGLQGAGRYVANPCTEKAQHPGLWVGGPLRYGQDQRTGTETVWQTLTRVRHVGKCAVNTETSEVSVEAVAGGTAGAAKALEALQKCRPVWRIGTDRRGAFRDDWPDTDTAEFAWRHWAHESEAALLSISDSDLTTLVKHFSPDTRNWHVVSRRFEIDPETNGGVFMVTGTAKDKIGVIGSQATAESTLATLPHKFAPVRRERTRPFGLAHAGKGEAWYDTLVCEWWDIDPASRKYLEWLDPVRSVNLIVKAEEPWSGVATTVDNERHWTGTGTNRRPWWRLATVEVSDQDDGLLGLKVSWEMPVVANTNGTETLDTEVYGGAGWGKRVTKTAPTVPTEDAEQAAKDMATPAGHVPLQRSVLEREKGYADVSGVFHKVWGYTANDSPPGMPTLNGVTAPDIDWRPDYCDGRGGLALTFYRVAQASVPDVVSRASAAVSAVAGSRLRRVHVREDEDGSCEVLAECETRKTVAEFSQLMSSDYFTNVYRREYEGLNISASGAVTDENGRTVTLVDALGNDIPTVNVGDSTILFQPGVVINVQYIRGEDCRYRVVVTTEVAVAREWEYEYETQRNGHPERIRVKVWRNKEDRPAPPASSHGTSAAYRDEISRFGLHDGQMEVQPDIHEEARETVSDSATERTVRRDAMHVEDEGVDDVYAAPGHAVTKTVTTHSDGLQDVSETDEEGKPNTTPMDWTEKRGGHDIDVKQTVHQNAATMPAIPSGGKNRASVSASVNRFGLIDATVRTETDVYETSRQTVIESPMERTERTDTLVEGEASASASAQDGQIVTESVTTYSDNKHDHSRTVEEAREKTVRADWTEKRSGHDIDVHIESRHNVRDVTVDAGDNERVNVSASANRFGLIDARVQKETDVWVKEEHDEQETAFQKTVRDTVRTDGDASAPASQTTSELKSGSVSTYSDGKHDTVKTVVTPKEQRWDWTWEAMWDEDEGGKFATAYGYAYRNVKTKEMPQRPSGGDGYEYVCSPHWSMNEFGLYDGTVTFTPHKVDENKLKHGRLVTVTMHLHHSVQRNHQKIVNADSSYIYWESGLAEFDYPVDVHREKTEKGAYSYISEGYAGSHVEYSPGPSRVYPWRAELHKEPMFVRWIGNPVEFKVPVPKAKDDDSETQGGGSSEGGGSSDGGGNGE